MQAKTETTQNAAPVEHRWTKAQMRRFNQLQSEVAQAQKDLERAEAASQGFISYLGDEYDLDGSQKWVIGPHGFMRQEDAPQNAEDEGDKDVGAEVVEQVEGRPVATAEAGPPAE